MSALAMSMHQTIQAESLERARTPLPWGLQLTAIAAVACFLHALCWWTVPPDMRLFLFPWYQHILQHGPVGAFAEPFSNYTPPYLYLMAAGSLAHGMLSPLTVIKLLSVAGTGFLALAVADLMKAAGAEARRAVFVFLLPTVVLNAALLGQCDALWAGACVFAVAAMIRGRTAASMIWCGVAIAFKAQAAFVAPFVIGALIGRRAPLWQWTIPALVYAALMLPAWLLGWPASDLATVYLRQFEYFDGPGSLSNPWRWAAYFARAAAPSFYIIGYAAAAASAVAIGALAARASRPKAMLTLALLSATALPFLLPKMHERYMFLADVLALALALAVRSRTSIAIAIGVQLASLSALASYVYNWPVPALIGAIAGGAALLAIAAQAGLFRRDAVPFLVRRQRLRPARFDQPVDVLGRAVDGVEP